MSCPILCDEFCVCTKLGVVQLLPASLAVVKEEGKREAEVLCAFIRCAACAVVQSTLNILYL